MYRYILACTAHMCCSYIQVHASWNIRIQTGSCQVVPSGTLSYRLISSCPLLDTRRYKAVQGSHFGTRRYKAVPKSPVPLNSEVQGSTWRYKALYRLVPHYSGVQDFWVLPCIAWYRLVPPCIQKRTRRYERKPEFGKLPVCTSTYKYILVHTDSYKSCKSMNCYVPSAFSTYQYKPVHTGTYRYVLVCTGMYWFVLVHTSTDK